MINFTQVTIPGITSAPTLPSEVIADKSAKAARMLALATALGTMAAINVACDDESAPKIEKPELTDTPENKAAFMADVKTAVLGGGVATLDFEAVWTGTEYKLKPIPKIDFTKARAALEADAARLSIPLDKMGFGLFVAKSGGAGGISYAIPYSHIASLEGEQIMKFEDYKQFIVSNSEAKPDVSFDKKGTGFLRISSLSNHRVEAEVITALQTINPYYFGK